MQTYKLTILKIDRRSGVKEGREWSMAEAHGFCVAPNPHTGEMEPQVGRFMLSKTQADIQPGEYLCSFTMYTDKEGHLKPAILKLVPVGESVRRAA